MPSADSPRASLATGDTPADTPPAPPTRGPWRSLILTGAGLTAFIVLSSRSEIAQRGMDGDGAPIYGDLAPSFTARGWIAVAGLVLAGGATGWLLRRRPSPARHVVAAVLIAFGFAASVALVRYDAGGLAGTTFRDEAPSYEADAHLLRALGTGRFVRDFPDVVPQFDSHMKTHPPGPLILVDALDRASPGSALPRGLAIAFIGSLVAVPTWFLARRFAGEEAARIATLLVAVAPGPVIFAVSSLDAVFALVLVGVAALVVAALSGEPRPWPAVAAGVALGLASFVTYAVAFIGLFAAIFAFATLRPGDAFRRLAVTGAGAVAGAGSLMLVLRFDLVRSYQAFQDHLGPTAFQLRRSHAFWVGADWGVWLLYAGLPIAALMLRELAIKRPWYLVAFFGPVVVFYALPCSITSLLPGENQRTLLFAYAIAAVAAGANLVRWRRDDPKTAVVVAFVLLSGAQAIALRSMYVNFY